MSFTRFWNLDGAMETTFLHLHFVAEFEDSSSAGTWYDVKSEQVFRPFTVSGLVVPAGRYDFSEANCSFTYNRAAPVSFGLSTTVGGFSSVATSVPSGRRYEPVIEIPSTSPSATAGMTSTCRPAVPTWPPSGSHTTFHRGYFCIACCNTMTAQKFGHPIFALAGYRMPTPVYLSSATKSRGSATMASRCWQKPNHEIQLPTRSAGSAYLAVS